MAWSGSWETHYMQGDQMSGKPGNVGELTAVLVFGKSRGIVRKNQVGKCVLCVSAWQILRPGDAFDLLPHCRWLSVVHGCFLYRCSFPCLSAQHL